MLAYSKYNFFKFFKKIRTKHFYFFAYALNILSISALIGFSGLAQSFVIATALSLSQSLLLVFFSIFSMNMRNIILSKNANKDEILSFISLRYYLFIPILLITFFILKKTFLEDVLVLIIIKKLLDWLDEVNISFSEMHGDIKYIKKYIYVNMFGLFITCSSLFVKPDFFNIFLALWIGLSIMINFKLYYFYIYKILFSNRYTLPLIINSTFLFLGKKNSLNILSQLLIAFVNLCFRALLVFILGPNKAGIFFSGYAIASFIPSLLISANAPSFFFYNHTNVVNNFALMHRFFLGVFVFALVIILFYAIFFSRSLYLMTVLISGFSGFLLYAAQMRRNFMLSQNRIIQSSIADIYIAILCFILFALTFLFKPTEYFYCFFSLIISLINFVIYLFNEKNFSFNYLRGPN
jgi:hypothetical protein